LPRASTPLFCLTIAQLMIFALIPFLLILLSCLLTETPRDRRTLWTRGAITAGFAFSLLTFLSPPPHSQHDPDYIFPVVALGIYGCILLESIRYWFRTSQTLDILMLQTTLFVLLSEVLLHFMQDAPWANIPSIYTISHAVALIGALISFKVLITLKGTHISDSSKSEKSTSLTSEALAKEQLNNMLATLAHDLRSPLASISMSVKRLSGQTQIQQATALAFFDYSIDSLIAKTNLIFDFNRLETGTLKITSSRFNIHNLISDNIDRLDPIAAISGVTFSNTLSSRRQVFADPIFTETILRQLTIQAIKLSKHSDNIEFYEGNTRYLGIRIRRHGSMPESESREEQPAHFNGTLDTAICKSMVEANGGKVVRDQGGNYPTYEFTLPTCLKIGFVSENNACDALKQELMTHSLVETLSAQTVEELLAADIESQLPDMIITDCGKNLSKLLTDIQNIRQRIPAEELPIYMIAKSLKGGFFERVKKSALIAGVTEVLAYIPSADFFLAGPIRENNSTSNHHQLTE
jgi:signal transduction histidine kinase